MSNKKPTKEMIQAAETTDSAGVTFCTLDGWADKAEAVQTHSRITNKRFVDNCYSCGKGICQIKWFVHMRIGGGIFKADAVMTTAYESAESQGWFPIGESCAKKYQGYCKELGLKDLAKRLKLVEQIRHRQ